MNGALGIIDTDTDTYCIVGGTLNDNEVAPGGIYVYFWYIPEEVGPSDLDPDCITNFYQSGVDPVRDTSSGLVGPLLVCKKGSLTTDGQRVIYFP